MATVIDLLRHLGHNAAPDGTNALAGTVTLPAANESPLPLPLPPALITAWTRIVRRRTHGHHALALSTAQTTNGVALMGHGAIPHDDLLLLLFRHLLAQPRATAICLLPDSHGFKSRIITMAHMLDVSWIDAAQTGTRIAPARLVLATPNDLHRRVLQFHDRTWRWLWPQLEVIALPYAHEYTGVAAGHLLWLIRRSERLAPHTSLQILAALASVADAELTLQHLFDRPLRVVAAPDGSDHATLIALWRSGSDREAAVQALIEQLIDKRLTVTALGRDADETQRIRAKLSDANVALSDDARVAVVLGLPASNDARHSLMRSGYRLLIVLTADEPQEILFAAQPELLLHALPAWPIAANNPYVVSGQLACAAAEAPLDVHEIDQWNAREQRDRLIKKRTLLPLPDQDAWQIAATAADPYPGLDMRTIGGRPSAVLDPNGRTIASVAPALLDRVALPDQVWTPGLRVLRRDDDQQRVQLATDRQRRATIVLADVSVTVREELAARTVHLGKRTIDLIKGRVMVHQRVTGLRELRPAGTQRDLLLEPLDGQWSAAACWFKLPAPPSDPATVGWALAQALPLLVLAPPAALVSAYDAEHQRLYLAEAEPGGTGVISAVYDRWDRLIEIATALALACAAHPLYQLVGKTESEWLHALRGQNAPSVIVATPRRRTAKSQPAQITAIETAAHRGQAVKRPTEQTRLAAPQVAEQRADSRPQQAVAAQADRLARTEDRSRQQANEEPVVNDTASTPAPRRAAVYAAPARPLITPAPPADDEAQPPATPTTYDVAKVAAPAVYDVSTDEPDQIAATDEEQPQDVPDHSDAEHVDERPVADNAVDAVPIVDEPDLAESLDQVEEPVRAENTAPDQIESMDQIEAGAHIEATDQTETEPRVTVLDQIETERDRSDQALDDNDQTQEDTTDRPIAQIVDEPVTVGRVDEPLPTSIDEIAWDAEPDAVVLSDAELDEEPAVIAGRHYRINDLLPPIEDEDDEPEAAPPMPDAQIEAAPPMPMSEQPTDRVDTLPVDRAEVEPLTIEADQPDQADDATAEQEQTLFDLPPQRAQPFGQQRNERRAEQPPERPSQDRRWSEPRSRFAQPERSSGRQPQREETDQRQSSSINGRYQRPQPDQARSGSPRRPQPSRPFDRSKGNNVPRPDRSTERPARDGAPPSDRSFERTRRDDPPPPNRSLERTRRDDAAQTNRVPGRAPVPDRKGRPPQPSNAQRRSDPPRPAAQRPTPQQPEAEPQKPTDVNAMLERLRRQREQREAEQRTRNSPPARSVAPNEPVELRFHIGDRVQCLPYGIGVVQASRIVNGREQVVINFPEFGEIEVDPAVSLVRPLEDQHSDRDGEEL